MSGLVAAAGLGLMDQLEGAFGRFVVDPVARVVFWDVAFWDDPDTGADVPIVVAWLILGASFFTLRFRFVNLRAFRHALDCVRGRFDREDDRGEISHFQALSAALSATVGLGNIAGVAVAVGLGGPGAVFWMVMAGLLGMSSKFAECTLGQKYRVVRPDGQVAGGPMYYLQRGLGERGMPRLGRVLAVLFSVLCMGGSFGAGNMFQSNQAYAQMASVLPVLEGRAGAAIFGAVLALAVGVVIVGGIRRIGEVASRLVPLMCSLYLVCAFCILLLHAGELGRGLGVIVSSAFAPDAAYGGFVGVLIQGFRRGAFSNEAGAGSAPIAHSAARTEEPVREGIVALLEPFIDTVVVCTATGLVIVVTGAHEAPEAGEGIAMTSWAFATVFPWFPRLLSVTALLFAFSTQISWSYYGERSADFLFGSGLGTAGYKLLFLFFVWFGAVSQLDRVVEFSDLMLLSMAFPNLFGAILLSGSVNRDLDAYLGRLRDGTMRSGDA